MAQLSDEDRENLVAYFDGELDEESARTLEAKLNLDPQTRRLSAPRRSFPIFHPPDPGKAGPANQALGALRVPALAWHSGLGGGHFPGRRRRFRRRTLDLAAPHTCRSR